MNRTTAVLALSAWTLAAPAAAQLTNTEKEIVAAVKARTPAALELLERAVRVNSGTLNPEGVREVGRIFGKELEGLGFTTRWVEMPPEMKRAGHLVATREGKSGRKVLIIGHLDTVFEKDSSVALWEQDGGRVRGQGVADMKGGDVIAIAALRALFEVGALQGTTIRLIFTGDEELVGLPLDVARAELVSLARQSDLALAFEGSVRGAGGSQDMASYARRSSGSWMLRVYARPGHSSRVFREDFGYGAIYEAARILDAFRQKLIEPDLTFNVGAFAGGTEVTYDEATARATAFGKTNVIAKQAVAQGDLRYLTPEQGARARERMREIVAASLPQATATIEFTETYPPMAPSEAGARLLEAYSKASQDAGHGPIGAVAPGDRGAGDVQFVAPYIPGLDGLGAAGSGAHTDREDMEIASIERGAVRAAILIYRLTR